MPTDPTSCCEQTSKDALLSAEVKPSASNAAWLRVVWMRPPFGQVAELLQSLPQMMAAAGLPTATASRGRGR